MSTTAPTTELSEEDPEDEVPFITALRQQVQLSLLRETRGYPVAVPEVVSPTIFRHPTLAAKTSEPTGEIPRKGGFR